MAIATQMPVEEYLHAGFDPECEFVDGEVLERNIGETDHAWCVTRAMFALANREKDLGVHVLPSLTIRMTSTHYRIADIALLRLDAPNEHVITHPPFACAEVLSTEDLMYRMHQKVRDYIKFGVKYVWLIDPQTRQMFEHSAEGVRQIVDTLRIQNTTVEIPLSEFFSE